MYGRVSDPRVSATELAYSETQSSACSDHDHKQSSACSDHDHKQSYVLHHNLLPRSIILFCFGGLGQSYRGGTVPAECVPSARRSRGVATTFDTTFATTSRIQIIIILTHILFTLATNVHGGRDLHALPSTGCSWGHMVGYSGSGAPVCCCVRCDHGRLCMQHDGVGQHGCAVQRSVHQVECTASAGACTVCNSNLHLVCTLP